MDRTCHRADLTVDQQHALLTAARTLAEEFAGTFGTETIAEIRPIRDEIERRVRTLLAELRVPVG